MIEIDVPGFKTLQLNHLVLDYNGTLAVDGKLLDGTRERLHKLSAKLDVHVLTADTFGNVESEISGIPCKLHILSRDRQEQGKLDYIEELGSDATVAIGNGRNDRLMLKEAALGIVVIQTEGTATQALLASDMVCPSILEALDLLLHPLRLIATLRS